MRNFIQPGNSLNVAVPYSGGVTAGQGVLVGALFGIAAVDGAQNAAIEIATQGVFDVTKEPALAISAGARVFWDNTNRRVTTSAANNTAIGAATVAALAADSTVRVVLSLEPALPNSVQIVRVLSLAALAQANTDLTIAVPAGHLLRISERTTVAFTGTTVTVQVGTTVGGAEIVAATDIKTIAARALTLVDASAPTFSPLAASTVNVRIVQTGPTAVGAGLLIFELVPTV